jgi:protein-S-isoprenylcysteine O-methyltransferase Ste14
VTTTTGKKGFLNRSRIRNVVLFLTLVSAPFCPITDATVVIGFSFLATGCFLHLVAKGILIRNTVLCNYGLYGLVRHPYYLANYLIDWSFCVLSGSYLLTLAYPFAFFWAYGPTMRKEEALLASEHGDDFSRYVSEVPRVFPDRSSVRRLGSLLKGFSPQRVTWKECARLTRFCSAAILITLVHDVTVNGVSSVSLRNVVENATYAASFGAAMVLYTASLVLMTLSKRQRSRR